MRVAWEVSDQVPFDEDDIAHLPIDPASGQRPPTDGEGVGVVVVGLSTEDEDIGDDEMEFPGAGLGVPSSRKRDHEPSVWYQVFVVDPPDLTSAIETADRAMEEERGG